MKDLKPSELRSKSVEELQALVDQEKAAIYKARRDFVFRQTTDTAGVKTRRHNIARMLTIITEKNKESKSNG